MDWARSHCFNSICRFGFSRCCWCHRRRRDFFLSMRVFFFLSSFIFSVFHFYILLNVLHGWMQKNATACSLLLCCCSFFHFIWIGALKTRRQTQRVEVREADGEKKRFRSCATISNVYISRDWYRFGSSLVSRAERRKYIHNGRSFARVEDNRIRRQISGNLHLMATAFSF